MKGRVQMIIGFVLLFVIFVLYQLLIKGLLFKIPLFIGGWFGIYIGLRYYFPSTSETLMTIADMKFSTAAVIPTVICFLALLTTKD